MRPCPFPTAALEGTPPPGQASALLWARPRPSAQFVSPSSFPSASEPLNPHQTDLGSHPKSHQLPLPLEPHRGCPSGPPQPSRGPPAVVDRGPDLAWPGASLGLAFLKTQEHLLTFPQPPRATRGSGGPRSTQTDHRGRSGPSTPHQETWASPLFRILGSSKHIAPPPPKQAESLLTTPLPDGPGGGSYGGRNGPNVSMASPAPPDHGTPASGGRRERSGPKSVCLR